MRDWHNGAIVQLMPVAVEEVLPDLASHLIVGEDVVGTWKARRDYLAVTSKRLVAVSVEGLSGRRRTYTTFPYRTMTSWAVLTPSSLDVSAELELDWEITGRVRLRFRGPVDMVRVADLIGQYGI
jgi:hypothetical protein